MAKEPVRPMAPARQDGRPLFFAVPPERRYHCALCAKMGLQITHSGPTVAMNDPANAHDKSGAVYTYCAAHLPENAVIYSPYTGLCRDKSGNTWREDDGPSPLRKAASER